MTNGTTPCPQTPCRMDFNGDRQVWVQARAVVRGKPRNVVARLKLELLSESVPQAGLVAGALDVTNNGNKLMIDGTGSSVLVRCSPVTSTACASYEADKGQVTPAPASAPAQPNFMTPAQLERFKARAIADGTYYPAGTCPSSGAELTGAVVWVEQCSTSYASVGGYSSPCVVPDGMSSNCINPTTKPGLLIWHCGTFGATANWTYYGIMYLVNNSDGTCASFPAEDRRLPRPRASTAASGGIGVLGALVVDGGGCVKIGSNGLQVAFDGNVFDSADVLRHGRPGAEHLARAAAGRTPQAPSDFALPIGTVVLKKKQRNNNTPSSGSISTPAHIAAAEVAVNGSITVTRGAVAELRPGILRDGEVTDAPALAEALKAFFAEHDLPKRVRLGVANQRIVVRSIDLPPLEDEKALAAAVRAEAPDHIPMPMDEAILDYVPLGHRRDAERPARRAW